jgi:hypothetical protein
VAIYIRESGQRTFSNSKDTFQKTQKMLWVTSSNGTYGSEYR